MELTEKLMCFPWRWHVVRFTRQMGGERDCNTSLSKDRVCIRIVYTPIMYYRFEIERKNKGGHVWQSHNNQQWGPFCGIAWHGMELRAAVHILSDEHIQRLQFYHGNTHVL